MCACVCVYLEESLSVCEGVCVSTWRVCVCVCVCLCVSTSKRVYVKESVCASTRRRAFHEGDMVFWAHSLSHTHPGVLGTHSSTWRRVFHEGDTVFWAHSLSHTHPGVLGTHSSTWRRAFHEGDTVFWAGSPWFSPQQLSVVIGGGWGVGVVE